MMIMIIIIIKIESDQEKQTIHRRIASFVVVCVCLRVRVCMYVRWRIPTLFCFSFSSVLRFENTATNQLRNQK